MASEKSTNVRSATATAPAWLRHGVGVLEAFAPELAGAFAERLFLRPPPRRRDKRTEYAQLLTGERRRIAFEDDSLVVYRWGEGPSVLLVHGWGGSAGQLTPWVEPLLQAGFSVLAFDAPGHGISSGSWLAIPRYAAAIQEVEADVGPLHAIVAHSLGAPATSLAIARGLQAERAVFVGPPADALAWFDGFCRMLELSGPVVRAARQRVEERAGMSLDHLNAAALGPSLQLPLLVIHDRDDREVPWSDGAAVAAAAPDARLVTTEGLGHRRILRDPRVIERTTAFLAAGRHAQTRHAEVIALPECSTHYRTSA
jgi:pimeloyl-ACP methyl ester carboxylesterase